MGFVEGLQKEDLLFDTDVFVLPSYQENFGNAVVEAMSTAQPVIVTDQVGIADEISENGAGIIVKVDKPEELSAAIELFRSEKLRRIYGMQGQRLVRDKYSIHNLGNELQSLYRKHTVNRRIN